MSENGSIGVRVERGEKTERENKKGRYWSISGDMFLKVGFKNSHYVS